MELKKPNYSIVVNIICLLLLGGISLYLVLNWHAIPDKIPGHYNLVGEVDRWGNKSEVIMLPIVAWIIFIGISVLEKFPQIWNTGVTVTQENAARVYRVLRNMIVTEKLVIVALFSYLTLNSTLAKPLPSIVMFIFILLLFGSIVFFFIRLNQVK